VRHGLLRQNLMCRLSETTQLSMETIHQHALQFVHGTGKRWRRGQTWTTRIFL